MKRTVNNTMEKYYYELHTHTSESSGCAGVCAADSYRMLKDAGARGMVVTDHFQFWPGEEIYDSEHWRGKVDYLLKGYRALKEAAADDPDFTVLLGFEYRNCSNDNDILVFGASEEFLYANEWFGNLERHALRKLADENGILLIQAHPFRGNCKPEAPDFIHGVEVYNEVPRHNSKNELALAYAQEHGLIQTAGSDFHWPEDLARGGIVTDRPILDGKDLVEILRSGSYTLRHT